ncbi:hypothetical protein ABID56_001258 [Alkalibacillus flavidus]|uniref:Sporulation histidine kinase inhibitor Sda n=1 Tax=Alkalibacillus flavidus TaxID=546021 RepID=A0ABV2KUC1_9BACI
MYELNDTTLIEAYREAIRLKLDNDFIQLIERELTLRGYKPHDLKS